MSSEKIKAVVEQFQEEAFNQGNAAVVETLLAPDYVLHDPAYPDGANRAATRQFITMLHSAVPDVRHTWEARVVAGDLVVTRWSAEGTQTGSLFGIPPREQGKVLRVTGIYIDRVADGRIAESWGQWDRLGMLQQIGVMPMPEQAAREVGA